MDRIFSYSSGVEFSTTAYTLFLRKHIKQLDIRQQQHFWWSDSLDGVICVSANTDIIDTPCHHNARQRGLVPVPSCH